ncbi:thioredoxin-dependent thiol peroxidase [Pleionea sediminis]|uniref:thioredoxin-dependent thiol peroxidase n=1 Tax=Pleionea sediminis TaxID=2569479 RepID=UPI001186D3F2|nr:thioredoxin-dependent thiol peroxidase [Pleionea sediminis]
MSKTPAIGKKAPNFNLPATGDKKLALKDFKGQKLVIYFYPKDATPGCTTEGQDFRDTFKKFKNANCAILGVSRDPMKSHERFKEKQSFPFDLLSDEEEVMCQAYDVIKLKKMYGKEYMGIERSTFLIDEDGKLQNEWRKVRVKGHVEEVLAAVKAL